MLKKLNQGRKRKIPGKNSIPSTATFNDSSDSDDDLFENAMKAKREKVAREEQQCEEFVPEVETTEPQEAPQKSKYIDKILEQKKLRDHDRQRIMIENQRKAATGAVFESAEYKKLAMDADATESETPTKTLSTLTIEKKILELAKSKVSKHLLEQARLRYFQRAGIHN